MASDDADDFVLLHVGDLASLGTVRRLEETSAGPAVLGALGPFDFAFEVPETKQTKGRLNMKKLVELPLGPNGSIALKVEDGHLALEAAYVDVGYAKLQAGYPVAKLLDPVKVKFIDELKKKIPGDLDDKIIDSLWEKAVAGLSEAA
jgi:hypothetical protein